MANATFGSHRREQQAPNPAAFVNPIGAGISLLVLVAMLAWGASTLMRDAAGIPVVEKIDGPMRVAPQDPGGVPADHQGLSVNEVAGNHITQDEGSLFLAPQPAVLTNETVPTVPTAATASAEFSASAEIEALAAQLAAVAQPFSDLDPNNASTSDAVAPSLPVTPAVTAITRSLRPQLRNPAALVQTASANAAVAVSSPEPALPIVVPMGTRMAQLGAYESKDIAQKEWRRLSSKFNPYLNGKNHVIQSASRDGKEFYRLRVFGFTDGTEARRFCSALISQNADCYPTVMK